MTQEMLISWDCMVLYIDRILYRLKRGGINNSVIAGV